MAVAVGGGARWWHKNQVEWQADAKYEFDIS